MDYHFLRASCYLGIFDISFFFYFEVFSILKGWDENSQTIGSSAPARDGRMEPHLECNTLGGGFNFKHADWDHFSDLIAHGSMDLESSAKRCKGKAKVDELTASLTTLIADSLLE